MISEDDPQYHITAAQEQEFRKTLRSNAQLNVSTNELKQIKFSEYTPLDQILRITGFLQGDVNGVDHEEGGNDYDRDHFFEIQHAKNILIEKGILRHEAFLDVPIGYLWHLSLALNDSDNMFVIKSDDNQKKKKIRFGNYGSDYRDPLIVDYLAKTVKWPVGGTEITLEDGRSGAVEDYLRRWVERYGRSKRSPNDYLTRVVVYYWAEEMGWHQITGRKITKPKKEDLAQILAHDPLGKK